MRGRVGSWETDRGKKGGRWGRKRRAEAFRERARAHASSRKEGGFRGIEAREEEGEGEKKGKDFRGIEVRARRARGSKGFRGIKARG